MTTITILVPERSVIQAIADPQYCFKAVNQFMEVSGKPPLFTIDLAGSREIITLGNGSFSVHPNKLLHEVTHTDLVIIPALYGDIPDAIHANKAMIPWIIEQYHRGAEVASLCVGAFLLASTGLLNGKKCSTHWGFSDKFRDMFPHVDLQDGRIVTETNRI